MMSIFLSSATYTLKMQSQRCEASAAIHAQGHSKSCSVRQQLRVDMTMHMSTILTPFLAMYLVRCRALAKPSGEPAATLRGEVGPARGVVGRTESPPSVPTHPHHDPSAPAVSAYLEYIFGLYIIPGTFSAHEAITLRCFTGTQQSGLQREVRVHSFSLHPKKSPSVKEVGTAAQTEWRAIHTSANPWRLGCCAVTPF